MGGKNNPPPPPDYSGLIAINEKTANMSLQLARDQFEWAKQTYKDNQGVTDATAKSFLAQMENSRKAYEEDRARYQQLYQPLEERQIQEARTYDTQERRDKEVGAAQANVAQAFDAARDNAAQQLESFGINPSSTRYAGLDLNARISEAAAKAGAGTAAATAVEDKARAINQLAVDVGRGYPGQYTAAGDLARVSGATANQGVQQAYQTGAQAMGTGPQWLGGANDAMGNWGNILNSQYQNQLGYYNAQQGSGLGGILGIAGGMAMKRFGFQEGGAVPVEASPTAGVMADDVPAAVSVGEFVVPQEAVSWFGEKHFHNLIQKAEKERAETQGVPV